MRRLKLPDHVKGYVVRYKGKEYPYFYFRLGEEPVRLPGLPWSPEFMEIYNRALAAWKASGGSAPVAIGASRTLPGTVQAAVVGYYQSTAFTRELAASSQISQRSLMERFRAEHGDKRIAKLERRHVQAYISNLGSPSVQRNMLRALRHLMRHCLNAGMITSDPTEGVMRAKMAQTGGFVPWTEEHVGRFEERHPVGTMARLALALYLNFGVRKGDVIRIGPRLIKNGELTDFQPQKTSRNGGKKITVPLLEETKQIIAATPLIGTGTYLVNQWGKPFTVGGFGNKMREWCDEAGLPDISSHGLRKLCLIRLAEAGFSAPAIASISGHKDLREIQLYIDAADRKKLARATMAQVEAARKANTGLSKTPEPFRQSGEKANDINGKI
jgi:integrase